MVEKEVLKQIDKDFAQFKSKVFAILLFGSHARNEQTERSDIDVCLVIKDGDANEVFKEILRSGLTKKYDIKIFENLPLGLKGEIIENHIIVWAKDKYELSYYFYKFRKMWKDQKLSLKKLGMKIFD